MTVRVQTEPFNAAVEIAAFLAGRRASGGIASFIGICRDEHAGLPVAAMTLEHYPGMTEAEIGRIEDEARRRWPLHDVLVVHRCGRLRPGEPIVLVLTASAHRAAALESCAFLIDWLKTRAPFWKLEETPEGERWVDAREGDEAAARRWQQAAE
jgi:molybdopterin synthase catalytic subunit